MQPLVYTRAQALPAILAQRIAILDGAMGTMIPALSSQRSPVPGRQIQGRLAKTPKSSRDVKGNNELLSLTRPMSSPTSTRATWQQAPT